MGDIPKQLIFNWDHTAIQTVSCSWTFDKKGIKRIEVTRLDNKRQIAVVVCGTLSGEVLLMQLIYQAGEDISLPAQSRISKWMAY